MTSQSDTPFHLHREKLFGLFEENQKGLVYLKGAELMYRYDTDFEFPFRQESNFFYLSGVHEPDYHMVLDLTSKEYHLFAPKRDTQYAVWHGRVRPKDEIQNEYKPDHLHYGANLPALLKDLNPDVIYCLNEEQAEFLEDLDRSLQVDTESLSDAITYCRCIKSEWELAQLREASRINSIAHREVLKALKPGMFEFEMKALFEYHQVRHGLMQEAYNGIHASGPNSAILHYVENNRQMRDGDLYLIDAGHEYNGYASDFTRTYPVNGRFSGDQAAIYQIVRNAHKTTIEASAPGVKMEELHMLAARIILEGLKEADIVRGTIDELMENDIFALFFPHGLGHFIGLDTHDVGGYPKGVERIDRPGIRFLRTRRELLPGMVITIEPGLYFIPALLKSALEDPRAKPYLKKEKLEPYFGFGGVRLEDNLIITDDGIENITDVPADIREIEEMMK
ncbi:MAG: aminopeptidase P family protein [Balneolaceae bacterium]